MASLIIIGAIIIAVVIFAVTRKKNNLPPVPGPVTTPLPTPTPILQPDCEVFDVVITSLDVDSATGNTGNNEFRNGMVWLRYTDCYMQPSDLIFKSADNYPNSFCQKMGFEPYIYYWKDDAQVFGPAVTSTLTNTGKLC